VVKSRLGVALRSSESRGGVSRRRTKADDLGKGGATADEPETRDEARHRDSTAHNVFRFEHLRHWARATGIVIRFADSAGKCQRTHRSLWRRRERPASFRALDGTTKIYDGSTLRLLNTVKFPDDADNIRYDFRSKGIIVGYAGAKALRNREEGTGGLGFIDSVGKQTGEVIIDAHPESFQLEKTGVRLFVNVPDKQEIEVIDAVSRTVIARWPVTSAKDNFPMALDEAHHRLFVATRTPPRLLVFDTESGKEIASGEIAGNSDDLFYDSARDRVYVLTSQGALDIFQLRDPYHYDHVARLPTPPRMQTGLFVPEWGKLYGAAPSQGDQPAEIQVYKAK